MAGSGNQARLDSAQLLTWAKKLQAIAQTGIAFTTGPYDMERYKSLRQIASEILAASASSVPAALIESFECETGYATPKIDVRAAVFEQDQLLLVKERSDGLWTLPGGWADIGDSPSVAAVRETKEESGYSVTARKLAAVFDRDLHGHPPAPFHVYKLFFLCDLVSGVPEAGLETEDASFFREGDLPPLSLSRVTPQQIAHLFDHHRHPDWPTSFD
jgi:ADP-ribose pyrophosphatase YjhB (NUDIX family)